MIAANHRGWIVFALLANSIFFMACGLSQPEATSNPSPTPTPTISMADAPKNPSDVNPCEGLNGYFELQLLVGPSDAVGLEPQAVGDIPFEVVNSNGIYSIQGANSIFYQDVLVEKWGTYSVTFDMDISLGGVCSKENNSEMLAVNVSMTGDQLVVVEADGFQQEYPWSGEQEKLVTFPLVEGATSGGEGWQMVLHINQ